MKWIKCKNEDEKLQAITDYCKEQIYNNNNQIKLYEALQNLSVDYVEEYANKINGLLIRNNKLETILRIINLDEFTSIMID